MDGSWRRVAGRSEVTLERPLPVEVDGVGYALVRLTAGGPVEAFLDHCPHRLVPLTAGTVVDGRLRCAYHGWEFGSGGTCTAVPSLGDTGAIPPRATLSAVQVREADGGVWLAAGSPASPVDALRNTDPALLRGWHPVALSREVGVRPAEVRLLGQDWTLRRAGGGVVAEPAPYAVHEGGGIIWLAPLEPAVGRLQVPQDDDPGYPGDWLTPARTTSPAGLMADNFLDVAHFPFVHTATFGAGQQTDVPAYDVQAQPGGFTSVQEQWFANPEDPGVVAGIRPVRQRRRATYVYRLPFQLLLTLEELDAGAVKVIFFLLQPEDDRSTRVYTKLLVHGIGGVAVPPAEVVAREMAFEQAVLDEDLALQARIGLAGLPLRPRDELHVRADRSGVALRRALREFTAG